MVIWAERSGREVVTDRGVNLRCSHEEDSRWSRIGNAHIKFLETFETCWMDVAGSLRNPSFSAL